MKVLDSLFGSYGKDLGNALTKATQRNALLAQNMANVNVPGYKRKDMDMNISLTDEANSFGGHMNEWAKQREMDAANKSSIRLDGNSVDLERETFAIAETELRYQMLSDMTNKYFSGLKNAIREGK